MAVSPIYAEGNVVLLIDTPEGAYLAAFDARTGKQALLRLFISPLRDPRRLWFRELWNLPDIRRIQASDCGGLAGLLMRRRLCL